MSPPNEKLNLLARCLVCGGDVTEASHGFFSCEGCGLVYNKVPVIARGRDVESRLYAVENDVATLRRETP